MGKRKIVFLFNTDDPIQIADDLERLSHRIPWCTDPEVRTHMSNWGRTYEVNLQQYRQLMHEVIRSLPLGDWVALKLDCPTPHLPQVLCERKVREAI